MDTVRRHVLRQRARVAAFTLLALISACASGDDVSRANTDLSPASPTDSAIGQFVQRTQDYVQLRARATAGREPLEETTSPEEIAANERAVAEAIRGARAGAKQGDIFGSAREPIAMLVRRDWRERSATERAALQEELPRIVIPAVNATYPADLPLETVPPKLLEVLPELPEVLEYRFVGPHLVLRDVEANLVVDVAPGVLGGSRTG